MEAGTAPLVEAHPSGFPEAFVSGGSICLNLFIPADSANPIEPLHRHRVRVITRGGKAIPQVYPDPRSDSWENYVAEIVKAQVRSVEVRGDGGDFLLPMREMRVFATLRFNLPKPKSYPKRVVHHTKKPDLDNYAKAVLDGLVRGRIIQDDGMVTDMLIQKRYLEPGHPQGVEVSLTAVPCEVP